MAKAKKEAGPRFRLEGPPRHSRFASGLCHPGQGTREPSLDRIDYDPGERKNGNRNNRHASLHSLVTPFLYSKFPAFAT